MPRIDFARLITAEARAEAERRTATEAALAAALARLAETDWMVIREAEGGPAVTEEVRAARQAARFDVSLLRAALFDAELPAAQPG